MRLPLRSFATLALAVGVASCSDTPHAPVKQSSSGARFALAPVFSKPAAEVYAQRATFAEVTFDHVRIVLVRPPNETVLDTIVAFDPSSPPKTLDLTVQARSTGEVFDGTMEYTNNGVVVYRGVLKVRAYFADQPVPSPQELELDYVGPGSTAARLVVSPKTATLVSPATASFSVSAFDANNTPLSNVPISWQSSDVSVATIDANGLLRPTGKRGSVTVTATTPTKVTDNASVTVTLPPASISVVSGGGQTGKAGTTLAQPGVVQVSASDGVGVAGVTVNFAAPVGGSVGTASVVTDENGRASTSLTLGGTLGPQSFGASAAGFSTSIPATATAGEPAAIAAVSGSNQSDTVRKALKAPFVAKVTDKFGNAVSGTTVTWTRTAGAGTLGAGTSTTNAEGLASMTYTLGSTVGAESVTATVAGVTAGATFSATALAPAPAAIVIASGNNQAARIDEALTLSVKVLDDQGNPIPGTNVTWTAINGSIPLTTKTDAQGVSSNTLTLGFTAGDAVAIASVGTGANVKSVSFSATVLPGFVARLAFRVQPSNAPVSTPLEPAVVVELQDAAGNRTSASNTVSISIGANPGETMLGGTRTKAASNGLVTFNDLTIDHGGNGYTLIASSSGLTSATSTPFNIGGSASLQLVLPSEHPSSATSGVPVWGSLWVYVRDSANMAVTTPRQVTATFTAGSAQNNVVTTNNDGIADFSNLILIGSGQGTVIFSAPGVQSASMSITVTPGLIVFTDSAGIALSTPPDTLLTFTGEIPPGAPMIQLRNEYGGLEDVSVSYSVMRDTTLVASGSATSGYNGFLSLDSIGWSLQNLSVFGTYVFTVTRPGFTGSPLKLNVRVVPLSSPASRRPPG